MDTLKDSAFYGKSLMPRERALFYFAYHVNILTLKARAVTHISIRS